MKRRPPADILAASPVAARFAGLRYVSDQRPGIAREWRGKTVIFLQADGARLRDSDILQRIRSLAIPPAWTRVWICPYENGHIQATGRDLRGRKQYCYHPRWREVRDEAKFDHMAAFAQALPGVRRRVQADLKLPGMPRDKVLATVVRLLETTLIRVGNDEYARHNGSHGLTTLHNRHARVRGGRITFDFKGKSGKRHSIDVRDPQLALLVRRCQDLSGQELFAYVGDDGAVHDVGSGDVNNYLRDIAGTKFSAKDFRTWAGTVLAARALREIGPCETQRQAKQNITQAVTAVAQMLGNTPAICRRSYIHPLVFQSYLQGRTLAGVKMSNGARIRGLSKDENAVLALLRSGLK